MKKDKNLGRQEVEYKQKAGTAWSHSYLNQKPWHPLSYPNQRRKWIAEQTHAQREQQTADVAREFAQEQEFFRQTSQMTKKEKEKLEQLQAVSFMYIRPPGYNAEAARAAEIADEQKKLGLCTSSSSAPDGNVNAGASEGNTSTRRKEVGKARVKDVFGRTLPTEEEFPVLKNAPRLETGAPVRLKPFAIEVRNVMCARCGAFGHQSGDRECSLKDKMMPNEEARLKREDPLNVILAQTSDEPLKWELKQQPGGLSPARGGFRPDDPNQQIIPDEDIYDEYGGFLAGGGEDGGLSIPNVLASLSREQRRELIDADIGVKDKRKRSKKKKKHKHGEKQDSSGEERSKRRHQDNRRPTKHEGGSRKEVSSSSGDEDKRNHSSDEDRMKTHRGKRRRAKREGKGKREESSSGREEERKVDCSGGDCSGGEYRKNRRPQRRNAAQSESGRKREQMSECASTDEDRRSQKHRRRSKSSRSERENDLEVSSDRSEDDLRSHRSYHEQRRKQHRRKRRSDGGDRRPRDLSPDKNDEDEAEGRSVHRGKSRLGTGDRRQKREVSSSESDGSDDDHRDTENGHKRNQR